MRYQVQENCLTIYLPREVDHHNADEIRKEADAVISRNHIRYVIFDFDRTDFMDSSGIGIIMGRYKTVSLIGGEVWAVHTNERIRKILTFSGAAKIMQIYEGEALWRRVIHRIMRWRSVLTAYQKMRDLPEYQ